ncbi:Psi-producing oxygenase A [Escovopsis weberi]|uniref:Psi-producing oxygenase A n=1 Tax=Escovopsis weberi TaxID=150374 RepID=A0A0M8N3L3_ESCWE|nr:Psi-producing oxygenase A [Escovopsis weberi]
MASDPKYQAGEAYKDPTTPELDFGSPASIAALLFDYASVRSQVSLKELVNVLGTLLKPNAPLDDKQGATESLIGILCALPSGAPIRTTLTNKLIDTLWSNLQHPPLSYVGGDVKYEVVNPETPDKHAAYKPYDSIEFKAPDSDIILREHVPKAPNGLYQYRMPDGSFNNILEPNLGRAGTPYARSVRPTKRMAGVKPDPGLLFDLLFARSDDTFRENPAGISSMLFYHAAIIIHDIFRTSRTDMNKSDTSSYLDLAPLYGSSLKDQLEIRTMKEGKLKPDTFHEKRLLGQPAGVNVMLVLYSRFHNYVADILLKINENGRFSLSCGPDASPEDMAKAVAKQDHDLFNVARLITGGLYVNISLHDYLRAITNTHHSGSDWTLDPRVAIGKQFDSDGVPRGVGNQVSVEFNLLYRFHACISKRDEKWINDFFLKLFPGRDVATLEKVGWDELGMALLNFEAQTPADPSQRTFDGLERQADGRFKDEDLVRILKESMEDPAGAFGSRMVPKALKIVEVLGINQARKWQVASLNEFREFFGLKRYEKFSEISSDTNIANILEKLYTDPDMVELYPGLMVEDIKPVRNPGSGICPTYSVGRAVLSDAVTLVRSDRFNTIDYTVANLTNWGFNEVQQDYKILGGSMLYKLIQRGVPGWFPFNSVAVMQPMYTKKMNTTIATELGTITQYTQDDPKPPRAPTSISSQAGIKQVLSNPQVFAIPWLKPLKDMYPDGKKDLSWFMLSGDQPQNLAHRASWVKALGKVPNLIQAVGNLISTVGSSLIKSESFTLAPGLDQLDIIRDVAIPLNARLLADMFYFDMRSDENPNGALGATQLYENLLNIRVWGVNNNDPGQAFKRRSLAQSSAKVIIDSTRPLVDEVSASRGLGLGLVSAISNLVTRKSQLKANSLRSAGYKIVEELLNQGSSPEHVTDDLWLTAFGGIGVPVTAFYEVLSFFLAPENAAIWAQVQDIVKKGDDASLHAYVAEAQRLTSTQRTLRVAMAPAEVDGFKVQPGDPVFLNLGASARNAGDFGATATTFDATRKVEGVRAYSYGQHECLAREVALAFVVGMVKLVADLKNLRPAPGLMGQVKTIMVGADKAYLNDSWSYLAFDASTWKIHFDGHGQGSFQGEREPTKLTNLQEYYSILQKAKDGLQKI